MENLGHDGKYFGFCHRIDRWRYIFSLRRFFKPIYALNRFSYLRNSRVKFLKIHFLLGVVPDVAVVSA